MELTSINDVPPYEATEEQRKHPKTGEIVTEGVWVGRGEDKKLVDPNTVWIMAEVGCSNSEICDYLGVTESTLKFNFSAYLTKARSQMKQKLRRAQLQLALSGNAVMLIWLGKNMLGQSDNPQATADAQPLPWNDEESGEQTDE